MDGKRTPIITVGARDLDWNTYNERGSVLLRETWKVGSGGLARRKAKLRVILDFGLRLLRKEGTRAQ